MEVWFVPAVGNNSSKIPPGANTPTTVFPQTRPLQRNETPCRASFPGTSPVRLAVQGMDRVVRLVTRKPLPDKPIGEPRGELGYHRYIAIMVGPEDMLKSLILSICRRG